jgi:hypothetical protein
MLLTVKKKRRGKYVKAEMREAPPAVQSNKLGGDTKAQRN